MQSGKHTSTEEAISSNGSTPSTPATEALSPPVKTESRDHSVNGNGVNGREMKLRARWWNLPGLAYGNYKQIDITKERLALVKPTIEFVHRQVSIASEEIDKIIKPETSQEKNALKNFADQVRESVGMIERLIGLASSKEGTKAQILEVFKAFQLQLPALFDSIDKLNAETLFGDIPSGVKKIEDLLFTKPVTALFKVLPSLVEDLYNLESFLLKNDKESLEKFAKLPAIAQDPILIILQQMNTLLRESNLLMGRMEDQFDLADGALTKLIKSKLEFKTGSPLEKLSGHKRSIQEWSVIVGVAYKKRLQAAGYSSEYVDAEEVYPFPLSFAQQKKLQTLVKKRKKLEDEKASFKQKVSAFDIAWDKVFKNAIESLQNKINKYTANGRTKNEKCVFLQNFKKELEEYFLEFQNLPSTDLKVKLDLCQKIIGIIATKSGEAILIKEKHANKAVKAIKEKLRHRSSLETNMVDIHKLFSSTLNGQVSTNVINVSANLADIDEKINTLTSEMEKVEKEFDVYEKSKSDFSSMAKQVKSLVGNAQKITQIFSDEALNPISDETDAAAPPAIAAPAGTHVTTALTTPKATASAAAAPAAATATSESTKGLAAVLDDAEEFASNMFDEDMFGLYFKRNNHGQNEPGTFMLKELGRGFYATRSAALKINEIVQEFKPQQATVKRKPQGATPIASLVHTVENADNGLVAVGNLLHAGKYLLNDPFLVRSFRSLKDKSAFYFVADQVKQHPWYQWLQTEGKPLVERIRISTARQDAALNEVKKLYIRLVGTSSQDPKVEEKTLQLFENISVLLQEKNKKLSEYKPSVFSYVKYVFGNTFTIYRVMKAIATAKNSLEFTLSDQMIEMIREFNIVMRDVLITIDRLELQFYLKDGFLRHFPIVDNKSLDDVVRLFHETVSDLGYKFEPGETYPYLPAMLDQRKTMAFLEMADQPVLSDFIKCRIGQMQGLESFANKYTVKHKQKIAKHYKGPTKKYIADLILSKKLAYENKRRSSFLFFGFQRRTLENQITALDELHSLVLHHNVPVDEALDRIRDRNYLAYKDLIEGYLSNERKFANILVELQRSIPKDYRPKKLIAEKSRHPQPPRLDNRALELIDERFLQLKSEWETTCFPSKTQETKLILLSQLKRNLQTMPLKEALSHIRNQVQHKDNYYLLYEGRTGELMKKLELSTMTTKDLYRLIDIEIERLRRGRGFILFFTPQSSINECIEALNAFKKGKPLTQKQCNVLIKHESKLLRDIELWDEIQDRITAQKSQVGKDEGVDKVKIKKSPRG